VLVDDFSDYFDAKPGFLDTASYGLLPVASAQAMHAAIDQWTHGTAPWFDQWLPLTDQARASFARLVGTDADHVATGPATSVFVGLVASALPPGSVVVAPRIEFTSNLFPYLARADHGVTVRTVAPESLVEEITDGVTLVAVSAVQSATGEVTDLEAVVARAREVGALVAVDATQGAGWLPLRAEGIDALICSGYKWLLASRGAAFMAVSDRLLERLDPVFANWWAGGVVQDSYYGPPLRLATSARRYDVSPAWLSWIAAARSLALLEELRVERIFRHDTTLAARFLDLLGRPAPVRPSAIVSLPLRETVPPSSLPVTVSIRDGRLRVSFHLYNTADDVALAAAALGPLLAS